MITQQVSDTLYSRLVNIFEEKIETTDQVLKDVREAAILRFKQLGFPTVKNEDWKYTNLHTLLKKDYVALESSEQRFNINKADLSGYVIPELDAYTVVMVNGRYMPALSDQIDLAGVRVECIDSVLENPVFLKHFAEYADKTSNPFVALNTALFSQGLFIHIEKNVIVDKPIHVVRLSTGTDALFTLSRDLYVIEASAELEIVESLVAAGAHGDQLINQVTEIVVEENANVQHYMIQESAANCRYINHLEIHQSKHSLYNNYNANFPGSDFVRNDINVRMDDQQVESHLYGIVLLDQEQFVDNHTIVDHIKPHGESYEWYKTITQDQSTAVFNGKIFVRLDAQKTNAFQQNNNVLIGDKSAVYSKPQLEIFADDVKCSHGCTIGQFDEESLFYLRARGIGEESARVLLVKAFAFDVTNRFSNDAIRHHIEELIEKSLK